MFLDRRPRYSKSTSNLATDLQQLSTPSGSVHSYATQPKYSRSRETLTVTREYNFSEPLPLYPPTKPLAQAPRLPSQNRSSTAPIMHPPDELFLKMVRRRSANARLEEMRIEREMAQKNDPELAMSLAIASALPPAYLDRLPTYTSPEEVTKPPFPWGGPAHGKEFRVEPPPVERSQAVITKFKQDELFLDDPLRLEIDETIAQYASFQLTEPTPVVSPQNVSMDISPMNEIDQLYLESRRRKNKATGK